MANARLDPTAWLASRVPSFSALPNNEKKAVTDFSLLWGIFERQYLNEQGSVGQIDRFVRSIAPTLKQDSSFLDEPLAYFQRRYVEPNRHFTYRFDHLHFRSGERRQHVEAVLLGHNADKADVLLGLLIIVYRFRNNFFHGLKWSDELHEQFDNFSTANTLLMQVMDLRPVGP